MSDASSKLVRLKLRREQLAAQIADIESRERRKAKVSEDRKKILLGAWVLYRVETNRDQMLASRLKQELPAFLTRDRDREFMQTFLDGLSNQGAGDVHNA